MRSCINQSRGKNRKSSRVLADATRSISADAVYILFPILDSEQFKTSTPLQSQSHTHTVNIISNFLDQNTDSSANCVPCFRREHFFHEFKRIAAYASTRPKCYPLLTTAILQW